MAKPVRLSVETARHVLISAQGLAEPGTKLVPVLERTGFVRTLGGVEAYLALRARVAGLRAADVHGAMEAGDVQVIPAVRGCMYLVARRDVPTAMRFAESVSRPRSEREQAKAGIRPGEVEKLAEQAAKALQKGPLTTDALRKALPEGAVRSLGETGKKLGISSPLPAALRLLEFAGRVERIQQEVRLDTERYLWRVATARPAKPAGDPLVRLAEIYLGAAGIGTVKELAMWAGVSQRDAAAAVDKLKTVPIDIDGVGTGVALSETRLAGDGAREAVAFLPFEDNLLAYQGTPGILIDAAHHELVVPTWGSDKETKLGWARHLSYRAVVADGKIVGFWDYDPDARDVVYACFDTVSSATRRKLDDAAAGTTRLLADEIGHGRSFSLDTDDELRVRCAWVRELAARGKRKPTRR